MLIWVHVVHVRGLVASCWTLGDPRPVCCRLPAVHLSSTLAAYVLASTSRLCFTAGVAYGPKARLERFGNLQVEFIALFYFFVVHAKKVLRVLLYFVPLCVFCLGLPTRCPPQIKAGVQPDTMTFSSLIATARDGSETSVKRAFGVSAAADGCMVDFCVHVLVQLCHCCLFSCAVASVLRAYPPNPYRSTWSLPNRHIGLIFD